MSNIFESIADFFDHLFSSKAEKIYDKLDEETKTALQYASGVIDVINKNLAVIPAQVITLIQQQFPAIDLAKLETGLQDLANEVNLDIAAGSSIEALIEGLQKYLSAKEGKFWEAASSTLSQILAIALAPDQTIFAKVVSVIEYVYRAFIKK